MNWSNHISKMMKLGFMIINERINQDLYFYPNPNLTLTRILKPNYTE